MSRAAIDSAVGSVLSALDAREGSPAAAPTGAAVRASSAPVVAAVTARSLPDLASRLRAALGREGLTVGPIGIAAAGLHHVATLELPASGRPALEAACRTLGAQVSIVSGEGAS